jgi:subtilisin family serine protease
MDTYEAMFGLSPYEYTSARDDDGHGTHTSSTAAGNADVQASIFGVSRGIVSGIAPRAHVIMYKVCGAAGCYQSDSAAAVEQAIMDGVNVINFSISGGAKPYSDAVELAFLDAYAAGVFVAASAGNAGPTADTTDHRGPWVTTVAASTQNRAFDHNRR